MRARRSLRRVAARTAPRCRSRWQLALALSLQEQHEPAEALLEQVLTLEPTFAEAVLCLCSVAGGGQLPVTTRAVRK